MGTMAVCRRNAGRSSRDRTAERAEPPVWPCRLAQGRSTMPLWPVFATALPNFSSTGPPLRQARTVGPHPGHEDQADLMYPPDRQPGGGYGQAGRDCSGSGQIGTGTWLRPTHRRDRAGSGPDATRGRYAFTFGASARAAIHAQEGICGRRPIVHPQVHLVFTPGILSGYEDSCLPEGGWT